MKLVKELNENNHVLEVPIFKQFHKFVIGKGGANIRKVRTEQLGVTKENLIFIFTFNMKIYNF